MAEVNRLRIAAIAAALVLASAMVLLVGGALALFGAQPARAQTAPHENFVPGEILVKFEPGASGQEIAEANRRGGGQVEQALPDIGVRVIDVPVGHEQSAVAAYEHNPNVSYAELNGVTQLAFTPDDPRVDHQWQYNNTGQTGGTPDADIDAFRAWNVTKGSSDVDIAILDTGIDKNHEDLKGKIVQAHNFTDSRTLNDKVRHGTHVAGSAAAVTNNGTGVAGTCPKCRLYNVKVIGDNGKGTVSSLVRGITWSTNHGAEVINMSLGTHNGSKALKDAVDYAWKKGVVLVAAAGNYHSRDRFYPAAYSHVIAVGATNDKDAKPKFSDYGKKWVDIGAPGVDILSTLPGDRYGVESGTSMATPHVAGAAGLVWSTNRCAADDNTCVRNRIEDRADQISGLRKYWPDGRRLNALNSVSP